MGPPPSCGATRRLSHRVCHRKKPARLRTRCVYPRATYPTPNPRMAANAVTTTRVNITYLLALVASATIILGCYPHVAGAALCRRTVAALRLLEVDRRSLPLLTALDIVADLLAFAQMPTPERSTAEMWTDTSFKPSSGCMKP